MAANDRMRDWVQGKGKSQLCESPIEELLLGALNLLAPSFPLPAEARAELKQQARVDQYRADFLWTLNAAAGGSHVLVVEADGHEYHERTKEQAAKDRSRDRHMAAKGYRVLRFTGSEIWANPFACAEQVYTHLQQLHFGKSRSESIALAGMAAISAMFEDVP